MSVHSSIHASRRIFAILVFSCLLLALPGAAHAQFFDFPLPDPPNASGSMTPADEPLLFQGNYCGAFAGASLRNDAEQSFSVDVVGEPVAAFFFWSGRDVTSASPDTQIVISGNAGITQTVTANASLDAHSPANFSWMTQSYDAVAGGFPIIEKGVNTFTVSGLDFAEPHGAGVMVISEDVEKCPFQAIGLYYGDDVLYHGWAPPAGPDSAVTCVDFPAPPEDVEIDIQMFVGGVENAERANAIWFETGSGPQPANLVGNIGITDAITMPLRGLSGVEFDNYDTLIQDPDQEIIAKPGDTWACVQIESPECAVTGPNCPVADPRFTDVPNIEQGISGTWINLAMRVPLFDIRISPDGNNPVGVEHTFDITVDASFGIQSAEAITITPNVEPMPDSMVDTCDTPVLTEKTASCSVTINSSITGTFTATAVAIIELSDGQIARAETNSVGDSSGPAVKTYFKAPEASIDIEKATNGEDADMPTGPVLEVGEAVTWSYRIENTGDYDLGDVSVTDDNGTPGDTSDDYRCDIGSLAIGAIDSSTCQQTGSAQIGQYANIANVIGTPVENNQPTGDPAVEDSDPSHYLGIAPDIVIEKATNGEDADDPTGPYIDVGQPVIWSYVVTNTGDIALSNVTVTDNRGVSVNCPKDTLVVNESMTCSANATSVAGQYANLGSVTGETPAGTRVDDSDPSHYFGSDPDIVIEKATNGEDADNPPGPEIPEGDPITWTYVVTNTGNVTLSDIEVSDDQGVVVVCPKTILVADESMTCTGTGFAGDGNYANMGTVVGTAPSGREVEDEDPSHYANPPTGIEDEEEPDQTSSMKIFLPMSPTQ